VVAAGVVLEPSPAAIAERLLLGELLTRRGLRRRRGRPRVESHRAEGGHARRDLEELPPSDPDSREALLEQVQFTHDVFLLLTDVGALTRSTLGQQSSPVIDSSFEF